MERTGPESLMVMAAMPIACRPCLGEQRLWELPLSDDAPDRPALLAALPVRATEPPRAGLRAWWSRLRVPTGVGGRGGF